MHNPWIGDGGLDRFPLPARGGVCDEGWCRCIAKWGHPKTSAEVEAEELAKEQKSRQLYQSIPRDNEADDDVEMEGDEMSRAVLNKISASDGNAGW